MLNLQPIFHVIGLLSAYLGALMLVPAVFDAIAENPDWKVFVISAGILLFFGCSVAIANRKSGQMKLSKRQAFVMTTAGWLMVAAFSALPFLGLGIDYSDAFFEAMSGITTTGSTVLMGLDQMPPGILLWRALLQWVGGVGIVVTAIFILPFLRVGGMQLFQTESSERSDQIVVVATELTRSIVTIYVALTAAAAVAYGIAGMAPFDAICHALTTVSTGGYANYDASFSNYGAAIHWVAVVFMIAGAFPFVAYIRMIRGQPLSLWRDPQARTLIVFLLVVGALMGAWLSVSRDIQLFDALRLSYFNVVSVVTTTGFVSDDFSAWGPLAVVSFFILMFVGGCTGSTAGSVKIYRYQVLRILLDAHLKVLVRPSRIVGISYHGRHLPDDVPASILAFVSAFFGIIMVFTFLLSAMSIDFVTALSATVTAITNVGPGLGPIVGPSGNFAALPDAA